MVGFVRQLEIDAEERDRERAIRANERDRCRQMIRKSSGLTDDEKRIALMAIETLETLSE